MAQEVVDQFMSMQEDQIVYCTSLDPEFYVALDREAQFALQIGDRLVRVMKYYHAGTEEAKALEARLTEMESMVEAYEANYMALDRTDLKSMAAQGRRKDRIAILASGAGSNAEAILAHFEGQAAAEVAEVVWVCTNREKAGVRQLAAKFGVEESHLSKTEMANGALLEGSPNAESGLGCACWVPVEGSQRSV